MGPAEPEIVKVTELVPGDVLVVQSVRVTVLRPSERGTETMRPLAGLPYIRFWCRREDTGAEGWMTYGLNAEALRLLVPCPARGWREGENQ